MNRGQASFWAIGTFLFSTVLGLNYFSLSGQAKTNDVVGKQAERLTAVEVRMERLPIIEAKLDKLLEQQNISPSMVERSIGVASSTSEKARF